MSNTKTAADWASEYGVQAALVNSDKELKGLFNVAVAEKWTTAKFQSKLMNSTWFKTHGDAWRVAKAAEKSDPASWKQETDLATTTVKNTAVANGIVLTDKQVSDLVKNSLFMSGGRSSSIDMTMLSQHIAETGKVTGQGGKSFDNIGTLKSYASSMGVSYNEDWYKTAATSMATNASNLSAYQKQINDLAKSKYAGFAEQIDAGHTVSEIASPYLNSMSNTLEVPAGSLSLADPTVHKALTNLDANGKPAAKPLWQFEQELKQDDRYFKTNQSHREMADIASSMAQTFGRV